MKLHPDQVCLFLIFVSCCLWEAWDRLFGRKGPPGGGSNPPGASA